MKCPMIMVNRTWGSEEVGKEGDRCIQEECAWWDEILDRCSIKTLGTVLDGVLLAQRNLSSKIPLGGKK